MEEQQSGRLEFLLTKLGRRQKSFVFNYTGDVAYAAKKAGYLGGNGNDYSDGEYRQAGLSVLKLPYVEEAIKLINDMHANMHVMDAQEIKSLWSRIARDEDSSFDVKIKASHLLSKCYPDFVEKLIVQQNHTHHHKFEFKRLSVSPIQLSRMDVEDLNALKDMIDNEIQTRLLGSSDTPLAIPANTVEADQVE